MKTKTLRRVEALAALYIHSTRHTDLAEESPQRQESKARRSQITPTPLNRKEELAEILFSESILEKILELRDTP